jgi:hypothetical protein
LFNVFRCWCHRLRIGSDLLLLSNHLLTPICLFLLFVLVLLLHLRCRRRLVIHSYLLHWLGLFLSLTLTIVVGGIGRVNNLLLLLLLSKAAIVLIGLHQGLSLFLLIIILLQLIVDAIVVDILVIQLILISCVFIGLVLLVRHHLLLLLIQVFLVVHVIRLLLAILLQFCVLIVFRLLSTVLKPLKIQITRDDIAVSKTVFSMSVCFKKIIALLD